MPDAGRWPRRACPEAFPLDDEVAAPGERLSIAVDVTPRRGMHLYAPGKHDYRIVKVTLDAQPWLKVNEPTYPRSEVYHFKLLNERVNVYMKPFRLTQPITLLATPAAQKLLAAMTLVTVTGGLEYQACDDKVCFNPARVPLRFEVALKALDRRPPGDGRH